MSARTIDSSGVTTWLDAVPALPAIGIQLQLPWAVSLRWANLLAAEIDEWGTAFQVQSGPTNLIVETDDGLRTKLVPNNVIVEGALRLRSAEEAGSFYPIIERSEVRPFEQLLDAAAVRTGAVLRVLAAQGPLHVERIGVMASMRFREETLPPGLASIIAHLEKPWNSRLEKCETTLLANLHEQEGTVERCHHHVSFDRTKPGPLSFQVVLDWQRAFDTPVAFSERAVKPEIESAVKKAQAYFERRAFDAV